MSYSNFLQNSAKMKFQAANAKPEKPRLAEQVALDKQLMDLQKESTKPDKAIDKRMYDELNKSWETGRTGGSGDAFISGLRGGLEKRSLLDDKERYKKIMDTTEKMRSMVEFQNQTLAMKEKEHYAKEYIKPRVMAYLDQANMMDPNARKVYLQHALDEYNDTAGTNYRVLDAFGSEPWKINVSDGEGSQVLDLMDFIKTSEEKKYELYMNSNEMRMAEQAAMQEHNMTIQRNQSQIDANNARSEKYRNSSNQGNIDINEKSRLIESGMIPEGSMLFSEIDPKSQEFKARLEELKVEKEKLQPTKQGIKALDNMNDIFSKYPKISTSLANWAQSKDDKSLAASVLKNFVNQDERAAIIELEKHAATLGLGVIGQFKGQRPTDILKKLIKESMPNGRFTKQAFDNIYSQYMETFNEQLERSDSAVSGWNGRYFPVYGQNKTVNDFGKDSKSINNNYMDKVSKIPGITAADIQEIERRLKEEKGLNNVK